MNVIKLSLFHAELPPGCERWKTLDGPSNQGARLVVTFAAIGKSSNNNYDSK